MVKKVIEWIAERCNNLSLSILLFIIVWSGLMLIPTSASLRDQRMENLSYALFMATGFYIFAKISKTAGAMILYLGLISVLSFVYALDVFFVIFSCMIFFLWLVSTYSQWKDKKGVIYDSMILIATINVIFQVLQYFHIYIIAYPMPGSESFYCGLLNNVNDLSAFYAILLPAFLRKGRVYLVPVLLLGLVMASTMTGVLATAIVLTIYITLKFKRASVAFAVIAVMIISLACYAKYYEDFSFEAQKKGRLYIWQKTIEIAQVKQTGWGINQYDKVIPLLTSFPYIKPDARQYLYSQIYDKTNFDRAIQKVSNNKLEYFNGNTFSKTFFLQAHNEFIEWYFIAGPLGVLLLLCFLTRYLWLAFWQEDRLPFYGLLAASITAFFFFTWHIIPMAAITVLYLGMIKGEQRG
jgi:hypothetical protein